MDYKKLLEKLEEKHKILQQEYNELLVRYQAAKSQHQQAKEEAKQLYGVSDIEELRELYKQLTEENQTKVKKYEEDLREFEETLEKAKEELRKIGEY